MVKRNKSRVIVDSDDEDDVSEEPKRPKVLEDPEEGEVEEEEVEKSSSEAEEEDDEDEEEEEEEEESEDDGSNADDEMDEEGKFPDGLDADLMGDEEDRARLQAMSEKEREQELFERLEKREALKTRLKIERQLKRDKKKKNKSARSSPRSSAAAPSTAAEDLSPPPSPGFDYEEEEDDSSTVRPVRKFESNDKSVKLNAIQRLKDERERKKQNAEAQRQQREQKQLDAQKRRSALVEDQDGSSNDATGSGDTPHKQKQKSVLKPSDIYSSDDEDDADQTSEYKFKARKKSDSSSVSSNVESSSSSSSDDSDKEDKDDSDNEDIKVSTKPIAQKDDLMRIRLSRHKLARWCHAPFFNDAVVGAFVRVNLGQGPHGVPTYRIAEIVGVVKTHKVYSTEGITTDKGLKLRYCRAERMYRLEFISNQPISDTEFTKWYSDMVAQNQPLPLMDDVLKKQRQLLNLANYSYTDQDVDAIVAEKSRFRQTPRNYAMKKTDLLKEKLEAESEGNTERLRMVQDQINEIEERAEMLDKQRTRNISAVTYINNRNKMHNLTQAEIAIVKEFREMKNKEGEDPFTRRKSRPTLVTKARDGVIDQNLLKELREKSIQHLQPKAGETPSKTDPPPKSAGEDSTDSPQITGSQKVNGSGGLLDENENSRSTSRLTLNGSSMSLLDDSASSINSSLLSGGTKKDDLFSVHDFDINIDVSTPIGGSSSNSSSKGDWSSSNLGSGGLLSDLGAPTVPRRSLNLEQYKRDKGLI